MLNPEETTAFLASIDQVKRRVASHLATLPATADAVTFIANLHRSVDAVGQQAANQGVAFDCTTGCAFCCYARVEATEPEIFHLVRALRNQSADQINALLQRLEQYTARVGNCRAPQERVACPFLAANRCTIYEVRPAACRKAHSLAVKNCATFAPEIPQDLATVLGAEALMLGTAEGYRAVNLHASGHELGAAVRAALADPTAEARWSQGESVFTA